MSLINDALKRAEAEKSQASGPLAPYPLDASMEVGAPRATPPAPSRRGGRAIALLAAVVLAAGGLAAWKITAWKSSGTPANASAAAVAKPGAAAPAGAPAKPDPAKGSPSTKPSGDAAAARSQAHDTIQKGPDAVKDHKPPEAGAAAAAPRAPQEDDEASEDAWEDEGESVPPASALQGKPAGSAASAAPGAPGANIAAAPAAPRVMVVAGPKPAPLAAKPAPVTFDPLKYKVNGVILGDDEATAILNGRIVKAGDTVDGAKVLKITARGVQVEFGGQTFVLGS